MIPSICNLTRHVHRSRPSPPRGRSGAFADDGAPREGNRPPDLRTAVHDLRNVVAPLRNAVQLLRLRGKTDGDLAPIADIIERQVNEMVRLLNALSGDHSAESAATQRTEENASGATACRRILIVDDNVALLTSLSSVLREAGHNVMTAEDGEQAIPLAVSWNPEFVLLDAHLPGINGFEVAKRLRQMYAPQAMTLVLMSGSPLTRRRCAAPNARASITASTSCITSLRSTACCAGSDSAGTPGDAISRARQ